jgi:hypothetical protein
VKEVLGENRKTLTELLEIDKSCRYSRSGQKAEPPHQEGTTCRAGFHTGHKMARHLMARQKMVGKKPALLAFHG